MGIQINGQTDTISAVDGTMTFPGTVTYEDVSRVNVTGIVTAGQGLHVTGGSVAIGNNTPAGTLSIYKDSNPYLYFQNSASGTTSNDGFSMVYSGSDMYIANRESGILAYESPGGTERLRITSDGKVGINSSSPSYVLDIDGTTLATVLQLNSNNATYGVSSNYKYNNTSVGSIGSAGGIDSSLALTDLGISGVGNIHFCTNYTRRVTITSGGAVIGPAKYTGSYTASSNLDITGFGYGNFLVNVRSTGVYHWNGVLLVTMFDTADFGVATLVSGNYSTTITTSMVNLAAGNGTLRLVFNRDFSSITVRVLQIG